MLHLTSKLMLHFVVLLFSYFLSHSTELNNFFLYSAPTFA